VICGCGGSETAPKFTLLIRSFSETFPLFDSEVEPSLHRIRITLQIGPQLQALSRAPSGV
jgi:hypothetical protein